MQFTLFVEHHCKSLSCKLSSQYDFLQLEYSLLSLYSKMVLSVGYSISIQLSVDDCLHFYMIDML